jgi:hypothetical protein
VDEELRAHHTDLLFRARLRERDAFVYVLLEHKSQADVWTAFHLLRYVVRIWDRHRTEHPDAKRLPPILPVVIHHGAQGWDAPKRVRELIDLQGFDAPTTRAFAKVLPDCGFVLDDLAHVSERDLRARPLPAIAHLALLCMQFVRDAGADDAATAIGRWSELVRLVLLAPDGQAVLGVLWS